MKIPEALTKIRTLGGEVVQNSGKLKFGSVETKDYSEFMDRMVQNEAGEIFDVDIIEYMALEGLVQEVYGEVESIPKELMLKHQESSEFDYTQEN